MIPSTMAATARGEIEYADRGDGPAVLFVHGSPSGYDLGVLATRFLVQQGFRVVTPSRPGYLGTPLTADTQTPDQQADLLLALMDRLGIHRFGLMSWSGGGPSSYRLAAQHGDRVTALAQVAAVSMRYEFASGIQERLMYTGIGRGIFDVMADHTPVTLVRSVLAAEGDLTKAELASQVDYVRSEPEVLQFVRDLAKTLGGRPVDNDARQFPRITDLGLDGIRVPTLLVHGTADCDVRPEHTRHAAERIPGAELVLVERGTHLVAWTDATHRDLQGRIAALLRDQLSGD